MKIAFVADIHAANHRQFGGPVVAGLNTRARMIVDTLGRAGSIAQAHGCHRLVVLGDLFDSARPSPPLVHAVGCALQLAGCQVPLIVGNHDRASDAQYDNAASPLGLVNGIHVIEQPFEDGNLLLVPFMPGPAMEWLPELMRASFEKRRQSGGVRAKVLGLHLGIWDDDTPPYLRGAKDAVSIGLVRQLMDTYGIGRVFAGNWHTRRVWRCEEGMVVIAGSTSPVNFGDAQADGQMFIHDTASGETISVAVPGPRWVTIDGLKAMLSVRPPSVEGEHLFVKVNIEVDDLGKARALRQRIEAASPRVSIAIVPNTAPVKEAARSAAAIARSATSFEDAVAGYVEAFPVAEPGTVDGVSRRLMEYRRGAG